MRLEQNRFGVACVLAATFSAHALAQGTPAIVKVAPVTATDPVAHEGDAADDPAIWVHPTDAERSLILGANKKDGLEVYTFDGRRRTRVGEGLEPNNVDVRYGIEVAGRTRNDITGNRAFNVNAHEQRLCAKNPNGIPTSSPRLRSYLGSPDQNDSTTPTGLWRRSVARGKIQPLQGCGNFVRLTQGSPDVVGPTLG